MNLRKTILFLIISITIILYIFGCSPKARYDVLNFVFDGVPDPSLADSLALQDSLKLLASNNTSDAIAFNMPTSKTHLHPPYQERECGICHDENSFGGLTQPLPELCYNCHENFNDKYQFVHAPVDAGECLECHNPHNSKYKKLLTRTGQDVCFACHDKDEILSREHHDGIDDTNCTECHNPHGGEDNYIFN